MIQKIALKGTEAVTSGASENFVLCDLPGFADFADQIPIGKRSANDARREWYGGMGCDQSIEAVRRGDASGVAASDRLLAEMETLVPVSKSWCTVDSVTGMCPNVPQYLAGNPYNMKAQAALPNRDCPVVDLRRACGQRRYQC
jgi:hypothetical protein